MDTATIIILLISSIIYLLIIYWIVRSATDTEKQTSYQRTMVRLMVRYMQEKGISEKELEEILFAHPNLPILQKREYATE